MSKVKFEHNTKIDFVDGVLAVPFSFLIDLVLTTNVMADLDGHPQAFIEEQLAAELEKWCWLYDIPLSQVHKVEIVGYVKE